MASNREPDAGRCSSCYVGFFVIECSLFVPNSSSMKSSCFETSRIFASLSEVKVTTIFKTASCVRAYAVIFCLCLVFPVTVRYRRDILMLLSQDTKPRRFVNAAFIRGNAWKRHCEKLKFKIARPWKGSENVCTRGKVTRKQNLIWVYSTPKWKNCGCSASLRVVFGHVQVDPRLSCLQVNGAAQQTGPAPEESPSSWLHLDGVLGNDHQACRPVSLM